MLLIRNASVFTMEGDQMLENADILCENGKVKEIGCNLSHEGAQVIDATGLFVTPGLIDAHAHFGGILGETFLDSMPDLNEITAPNNAALEALYAINIDSFDFKELPATGITAGCFIPGSANVICGRGFVAKTAGKNNIHELTVRNPAVMKCALGSGPMNYGKRGMPPMTRMGVADIFREGLRQAKEYMERKERAEGDTDKMPPYDAKCEALIPVLKREIPLKIHCCMDFDILTAINISKEFGCRYTLDHAWGANHFADEIVAGGEPMIMGPFSIPEGCGELAGGDIAIVKDMHDRGITVCLTVDGVVNGPQVLIISTGEVVRCGVDHMQALRMITINPANVLGVGDRLGSLKPGKDADLVVWSAIPALETSARPLYTVIEGKIVFNGTAQ